MYQEIRNNVKHRIFVTIGSTSIFWTNDIIYHAIWGHLLPLPYQFAIFEDVVFDSPGKTTAYSCLMTWGLMTITSIGSLAILATMTATVTRTSKQQQVYWSKQQACMCITLFCTFLSHYWTTTMWKCLISCFMEDVNKQWWNFLSLFKLGAAPKKSTPGKFAYIGHFQRTGINAAKFEKKLIFAAVATINAKTP